MITYLRGTVGGQIVSKPSNGLGEPSVVVSTAGRMAPTSWSGDGKEPRTWVHETGSNDRPLLQNDAVMGESQFSRDGKWVAHGADETGQYEVYVAPFPSISSQYQVSLQGGTQPRWSRDGKRLYFIAGDKRLMVVNVFTNGDSLKLGPPRALFQTRIIKVFEAYVQYDVSPNEQRFLINTRNDDDQQPLNVFANWAEELKH
jgi:hypothetical protein